MQLLLIVLASAVCLTVAYRYYGSLLARLLGLDAARPTPAYRFRDDVDFVPTEPTFLLSQHFSAIAAAGPIVGPILAGLYFGWVPALIWILLGSIFVGGVHDMTSLVASIRHKARSIAEIVREHMSRRSYVLFLSFIWIALVYIIVAFTDVVARSFVGSQVLEDGVTKVSGGGIATSSLLYLLLPVVMGVLLRFTRLTVNWATVIFLPLVGVAIWLGPSIPLDLAVLLDISDDSAVKVWDVLLLGYCLVAGALPVWLLLQPRGHLGGFFLYIALLGGVLGIIVGGVIAVFTGSSEALAIHWPAFMGWQSKDGPLLPILVITVACGACSGFHCLIASGTTSKQLRRETDAKPIGYGAMLLEAMVAVVSLSCVMVMTKAPAAGQGPNYIYARGLATFLDTFHIPVEFAIGLGLLAFTTFVYDTLDVCTRLGRFIIQELTGLQNAAGRWIGTGLTALVPLLFVTMTVRDAAGKPIPVWRVFWALFGASNQLLAALALLGVTVWLWRTQRARWVWAVTGLPMVWMYVMSIWALVLFIRAGFFPPEGFTLRVTSPVPWAALVLVVLAALLLIEAVRVFLLPRTPSSPQAGELETALQTA